VNKKSDYTCICVVGVDPKNNYYILDIERFRTEKIRDMFDKILQLHNKWGFRKLRAEVVSTQNIIVRDLKDNYIRPFGLALSIDEFRPNSRSGAKEERIAATLYPRYENQQIWHYKGGNCQILEEELVQQNPAHDDVKDALTITIDVATAPSFQSMYTSQGFRGMYNERFGGIG